MTSTPYASFLDTSTDLGGTSHAAWNENGVLLHAAWDPVAGRWGDAAQIGNATSARNIQLTPGTTSDASPQAVLLASWESGEANNADLFLSVGFYESDGRVVWSDVLQVRDNGQADRNHRIGAIDGAFVLSNEVRQEPGDAPALDASYQDSEIATTVLRVKRRTSVADGIADRVVAGSPVTILNLSPGERLLRLNANGQWFNLESGDPPLNLPRLGELRREDDTLRFSPSADFAAGAGSVQFTFERATATNVLRRSSFEVFAGEAPGAQLVEGGSGAPQAFQLEMAQPGTAFETLPIGFSQAINRERITRDAFSGLVPRRGGSGSFRELSGDGLFGDRAAQAVGRRLNATAQGTLLTPGAPPSASEPIMVGEASEDGAAPSAEPVPLTAFAQATAIRYQETYTKSWPGFGVEGLEFLTDRYELNEGLPVRFGISLEDVSKTVDGAGIGLGWVGDKFGKNFSIALTGSFAYDLKRKNRTVGYRTRLSIVLGDAVQAGDTAANDLSVKNRNPGAAVNNEATRGSRARIRSDKDGYWKKKSQTGASVQFGYLFGVPFLRNASLGMQSSAQYPYTSSTSGSGLEAVARNAASTSWGLLAGFTFGAEARLKLGGFRSSGPEADPKLIKEFTLAQIRGSVSLATLFRFNWQRQNVSYGTNQGSQVLDYKADGSRARLRWLGDETGALRITFNTFAWANILRVSSGGAVNTFSEKPGQGGLGSVLPGPGGAITGRAFGPGLLIAQSVPWIGAWGQGLDEAFSGNSASGSNFQFEFEAAARLAAEFSLFNRMIGAKAETGLQFQVATAIPGTPANSKAGGFLRLFYTLAGIDVALVNEKFGGLDDDITQFASSAALGLRAISTTVGVIDYTPKAAASLSAAGVSAELRPQDGRWPTAPLSGDSLVAPGSSSGQLVRAVLVVPEASAFAPADLNADGTVRDLRLQLTSPGALQVVVDRRAVSGQPLAYDDPAPWLEILRDGDLNTASRTVTSAPISGLRPGDRLPLYIDRRAALDAVTGLAPDLRIGLRLGASGSVLDGGQVLVASMPDSPTLSARQGSSYVLGVQEIADPEAGLTAGQRSLTRLSDPYLAGLLLQSAGRGYRGTFDFVIDTGSAQGAQARALVSTSEAGFLEQIVLVRPGEAPGSDLTAARGRIESDLKQVPFRTRLASGSTAVISVAAEDDGSIFGLNFGPGNQGSGYLGGGSGSFYQRLQSNDAELGARELLFKVAVRDGQASSASLLSASGRFRPGERFELNDDASGGGEGGRLLPVLRDWQLRNQVDEQDIAIGSDLRFQDTGKLAGAAWLTYTQAAPLGRERDPIASQGAQIQQPVRISRFSQQDNNWQDFRIQPSEGGGSTPGIAGYNINPVIAQVAGRNSGSADQVLVFSHADTSMIRSEDDLYLLDQALLRSDLYYSYRNASTDRANSFPTPRRVPLQLPAGVTLGLTNNRPYLTAFDNTGGALIAPSAQPLPPSLLLAWLSSSTPNSFDADVTIGVTIGTSTGSDITWGPVDLIDPGEEVSGDDIVNLSLTTKDGQPVLSWSVLTETPYRALVLEDKPLVYLRLDEPSGSDSFDALGELAGTTGQLIRRDQLEGRSSPFSAIRLDTSDAGSLQSLDDGALWDSTLGIGDPNQALRFRGGEYLDLANPLVLQALQDPQTAPSGYGVEVWIRPQADGQGRLLDGSILDAGLYNPAAVLPEEGAVRLPFQWQRQAAEDAQGQRGWRTVLQLEADLQANLSGASSSGLSPYNLATLLPAQTLSPQFSAGPALTLDLPDLQLSGALSYQTRDGSLSSLFSGPTPTPLWETFTPDASVSAEQVRQGLTETVSAGPLPLGFTQVPGWSLRQQNGELVFHYGDTLDGQPLSLRSTALKAGEWNHVQLGYGFTDAFAPLSGNTDKRATLVINGQLVASADDLGLPRTLIDAQGTTETVLDYAGFDFNALPLQLGYGFRGDLDELAFHDGPLEDLERSSQQRLESRFVDPRSASQATFFSTGRWDSDGSRWDWGDPEKYTYSAYLGSSNASSDRRANGQQVIDLAGAGTLLRGDGLPDAARRALLPREIPLGSRLTGIRIESDGQVFAVGDGRNWKADAQGVLVEASPAEVSGLIGVVANRTATNPLLNQRDDPSQLDLAVLARSTELRLFYASQPDYQRGIGVLKDEGSGNPLVTYFYRDPAQQVGGRTRPQAIRARTDVIANPSQAVLERGSAFSDLRLEARAIVERQAPTGLAELNAGFQVSLSAEPTADHRFADRIEVGQLNGRPHAAILSSQADLEGGSAIVVLDLSSSSEAELQKLRRLDQGEASLAVNTRAALAAAGVNGLRIQSGNAGQSVGSTLLWADLDGDRQQELIVGNPEANGGNGEVWILSGAFLQQVSTGTRTITLNDSLLEGQAGAVRRLRLPAAPGNDRAGFGTSLAAGVVDGNGLSLVIGAPGQISGSNPDGSPRRDGAIWRVNGARALATATPELLANGTTYASSGSGTPQQEGLEFGASLALARLNGQENPATLLVGLPGLEATYQLRNGGHTAASDDQLAYYREVLRTTAPKDSEPQASEKVTVQAGGVLALDLVNSRQLLLVGETFAGEAARAGEGLASGGSFDGGTADDVAIGLPEEDNGTGAVALLRGEDLRRWLAEAPANQAPGFTSRNRRALIGNTALYVHGIEAGNRLGRILRLDGNLIDADQTRLNDLVIGDPQASDGTGEIHVINGRSLSAADNRSDEGATLWLDGLVFHNLAIPDPEARLGLTPGRSFAGFGNAVALANVNGTASGGGSLDDLVMASSRLGSTLTVLYGKDALRQVDRLDLRNIASGQGLDFVATNQPSDAVDGSSAVLADINGDGYGDALLGKGVTSLEMAYGASSEAGASHPDAGTGGQATLEFEAQLARLQGRIVPTLPDGGFQSLRPQIQAVQAVGDLDGDGASELLISSGYRDRLLEGETLGVGESLVSANGKYILTMQLDGNLALYTQIADGQRRLLFSLFGSGYKLPGFTGSFQGGSTLQIMNGRLMYVPRPADQGQLANAEVKFDATTTYRRQKAGGSFEDVPGTYNMSPATIDRGANFGFLQLRDDGSLVAYGKPEGLGGGTSTVYFALQPASPEIQQQAVSGAALNKSDPSAAPLQYQSLLFSGAANSNAGLAAGQVLEAIDLQALQSLGISRVGPYLGTTWLNGEQTLLFAHPRAGEGVAANQLLLARPHPQYRERYSDTAGLLRAWGADVKADAGLNALIEQIVAAFQAPAGTSLDDRFAAALANTDLAVALLEASSESGERGLDFQQFLARQVPLYRLEGRTLLDPDSQQGLASPLQLSLLDLTGDGSRELFIYRANPRPTPLYVKPETLAANQPTVLPNRLVLTANGANGALTNVRPVGDVDGNGHVDLIAYDGLFKKPHLLLGRTSDQGPTFKIFSLLSGGTRDEAANFLAAPAGDVNGDSLDDFLIEGRDGDRNGFWIVYGQSGSDPEGFGSPRVFGLGNKTIDLDKSINGIRINTFIETLPGWSLSDLRGGVDFNGDGLSDVQVTLRSEREPATLRSYILFGGDFTQARTLNPAELTGGAQLIQSITQMGDISFDNLRGTPAGDTAIGREGDDLLNGQGGPDVLNGGPGNDVAIVADDQFRRVDGGPGEDALLLNGFRDQSWDLTRLASGGRLANLETLDISDFGSNTLRVNLAALLAITDSRRILTIEGDAPARAPLAELQRLLERNNPRFASEFAAYLQRQGTNDEQLRIAKDGQDLRPIYQELLTEFWRDYRLARDNEGTAVFLEFEQIYGLRVDPITLRRNPKWTPEVIEAFDKAVAARSRPDFSAAARDAIAADLATALSKADTVLLADGPGELRLDPEGADLVLGSERYWVYTALGGQARLLVADGIRVLRTPDVAPGLIPTPWTSPSEIPPARTRAAADTPVLALAALAAPAVEAPGDATAGEDSGTPLLLTTGSRAAASAADIVPIAGGDPSDQRFLVDTPVVSQSEKRIRFTVQRLGYLDDTSRLAFRVLGYTADLVPAAYGEVVFAPGETRRTLEVPLIQLEDSSELLSSTEVSVELIPLAAGSPGPRDTVSFAINALEGASETVPDPVQPLPADLRDARTLLARGAALPLARSLTSRDAIRNGNEVVFGLSSVQGPGANDVWLRRRDGEFLSIYDPGLEADLRLLDDSFEEADDGDLFLAVSDGGALDDDGQRNGSVDLTALPVLTSPGPVLLNGRVLRAPTQADARLWLDLAAMGAGEGELLFVPVLDDEGSLEQAGTRLRPGDAGYGEALADWLGREPAGLRSLRLGGAPLSQAFTLQPDTDYVLALRRPGAIQPLTIERRTEASSDARASRSDASYRLSAEDVALDLRLSSNLWVTPGIAGASTSLWASYQPAPTPLFASSEAAPARQVALVRTDTLSGGLIDSAEGSDTSTLLPGDPGHLEALARRLAEPDGGLVLDADRPRQALPFLAGDPLLPVLFEGISAATWAALPAEQRQLQGPGWRLLIGGDDGSSQALRRDGADAWSLAGGGTLRIGLDPGLGGTLLSTPLAEPLLQFVTASRADLSGTAASLQTPINLNADLFTDRPSLLTGNYGFEGSIGIPGLDGTDTASQQIAAAYNVAWNNVDPSLNASQRAYTSAVSTDNASKVYGVDLQQADNMPLVFSHPLLPTHLDATDFVVTLSDGSRVTPQAAALLPNLEFNERQTVVISGDFGNRLQPGEPGALFPVSVTVVNDGSPLELLTADGPVSAVGLTVASANPYVDGNGPTLVAAKLNRLNNLGEGGPIGVSLASQNNSGLDLYGSQAQYRLRLYTSAGFSPDGITSLLPSEFSRYFLLEATAADGATITIDQADTPVRIGDFGSITVLGLADLAQAGTPENAAYVEDHDNYYDIILAGDAAAIARLSRVRIPSGDGYQAVYNPGGPGNDPGAEGAAPGPFTVASDDQSIAITQDLDGRRLATFVEVDGPVLRNPFDARPIGSLLGVAIEDTSTGQRIDAYEDPQGRRFYGSFAAAPDRATDLPDGLADTRPIDLLDTRAEAAETSLTVSGSLSRSASYASTLQFYAVLDAGGTVRDPVSGQLLQPSDPGYRQAALSAANLLSTTGASLSAADGDVTPFSFQVRGGQLFAPVLTVADTRQTYFSFAAANTDRISHFNGVGANAYGIEDLAGGGDRDYDDLILRFAISS